jgi:ribA/ribD-fused uncharacterized protein
MDEPINILDPRADVLSPFSNHSITVRGEVFPTVEHAYQSLRIIQGKERDLVRGAPTPLEAWQEGQKYKNNPELLVKNFKKDTVMEELFRAKLAQHEEVRRFLQETGTRELRKVHDTDYYWGTGADGSGENRMGKLWMKLRDA